MDPTTTNDFQQTFMQGQQALQYEAKIHQDLDKQVQALSLPKQKYLTQISENTSVLEELNRINENNKVFKQVGPSLVQQDLSVAKDTVKQRLEFMQGKVQELDETIKTKLEQLQASKEKFMNIQTMLRKTKEEYQNRAQMAQAQQQAQQQAQIQQAQAQQQKSKQDS